MRKKTGNRGFTLLESLAASLILALGLFVLGGAFYTQLSFINQAREKTIAALAAQEEVETIRGLSFDAVLNLGPTFTASGFAYLNNPVGTITVDDIYGNSNVRRVSVTVSWTSLKGVASQRDLVTLVSRNGIDKQ